MTSEQVQSKLDVLKQNLQRLAEIPQTSYESFVADFRIDDRRVYEILVNHRNDLAELLDLLLAALEE